VPLDEVGNGNILPVVDNFTKYVELFPVKSMDAETTAQCLISAFARYGNIKRVRGDRGSQFLGRCARCCVIWSGVNRLRRWGFVLKPMELWNN
jgi:hypothetical protein